MRVFAVDNIPFNSKLSLLRSKWHNVKVEKVAFENKDNSYSKIKEEVLKKMKNQALPLGEKIKIGDEFGHYRLIDVEHENMVDKFLKLSFK